MDWRRCATGSGGRSKGWLLFPRCCVAGACGRSPILEIRLLLITRTLRIRTAVRGHGRTCSRALQVGLCPMTRLRLPYHPISLVPPKIQAETSVCSCFEIFMLLKEFYRSVILTEETAVKFLRETIFWTHTRSRAVSSVWQCMQEKENVTEVGNIGLCFAVLAEGAQSSRFCSQRQHILPLRGHHTS
ncbi:hypothetical protein GWK47_044770 [Chionoecetes opilio]|uniref:Uncharacterized protein n=1 Tax=Chionoecetes opilio TaxID=41210 RepID=A0A8J4YIX1_CHIOP|nr:hypothetical protein GWK47_044770 [Chionoecetes opilio]